MTKIAVLFSGGKDSVFTAFECMRRGHEVACLITMRSENNASWMFHTPAIHLTELQAEAMKIPLMTFGTKGEKEKELADLTNAISEAKKKFKISGVAAGALASVYQKERVEKICSKLGLECIAPLWQRDQKQYLEEIVSSGFDVRFVGVAAKGLDKLWLGRKLDSKAIGDLAALNVKFGSHIGGEGGEYESLVVDGPIFGKRIELLETASGLCRVRCPYCN